MESALILLCKTIASVKKSRRIFLECTIIRQSLISAMIVSRVNNLYMYAICEPHSRSNILFLRDTILPIHYRRRTFRAAEDITFALCEARTMHRVKQRDYYTDRCIINSQDIKTYGFYNFIARDVRIRIHIHPEISINYEINTKS